MGYIFQPYRNKYYGYSNVRTDHLPVVRRCDVNIDITVLIAVCGFALSVGTFFVGRMTAAKNSGQADGEIKTNVQYIKDSVDKHDKKLDKIMDNYSDLEGEIRELKVRLKALEDKVKMLHGGEQT